MNIKELKANKKNRNLALYLQKVVESWGFILLLIYNLPISTPRTTLHHHRFLKSLLSTLQSFYHMLMFRFPCDIV
jgi:hypothetical protein